jgi:hypothetical protein
MSRRRLAAAVLAAVVSTACNGGADTSGRLVVDRVTKGSGRLLDEPAHAIYCPAESLLTVIAVGGGWSGGLALHVVLPVRAAVTLPVRRPPTGFGTASAAFRPASGVARLGIGGTVTLAPSSVVDGVFSITVTDSTPPDATIRGRLSRIPYSTPSGPACLR